MRKPIRSKPDLGSFKAWLMLGYHFNAAVASYLEMIRRDPEFAVAWCGITYASEPNQNNLAIIACKDEWRFTAANRFGELCKHETGANRALIGALVAWYQYRMPEALTNQNTKYLDAMQMVHESFPLDTDVAVGTAKAMICLHAWNNWTLKGEPVDRTPQFRAILEVAMRRFPDHPAADHLYIYTMKSSP